ncbi:MAG: ABC transporter ATP-binding protein [Planctomycetes bacterium]|nr:ABC transporter ATP-binding protein [Planctomycetota bacterium]MBI3845975.1 ABC transporter ATP-binding protein [Planctomycetota bacterium]
MKALATLWPYLKRHRAALIWGFVFVVCTNVAQFIIPRVLGLAIDRLRAAPDLGFVGWCALGIIGLALVRGIFQLVMRWFIIGASRKIEFELRQNLYGHLQTLSFGYFNKMKTGDILSRSVSDIEGVRMLIVGFMYLSNTAIALPFALANMFQMNAFLALVSLIPLVLLAVTMRLLAPRLHEASKIVQEQLATISSRAQENFAGVRVVKAFAQEPSEQNRFRDESDKYVRMNMRLARMRALTTALIYLLGDFGILVILWVGGKGILSGSFTLGDFIAFQAYQLMLLWPMIAVGWVLTLSQRGVASMGRLDEVLKSVPEIQDPIEPVPLERVRGEIEFRGLTFAYPDAQPVLRDVRLHVPAGTTVAVVGRTGSGKSTLVNLIPRLFSSPPGTLFVDGVDVNRIPLAELRHAIGYVPQETFLFSDTIRENIAFGLANATDEAVERAARQAQIHDSIVEFPNGYAQIVGERGVTLSGGQKQRVAIARALVLDPAILILDDCLSAVDTHTEEEILKGLRDARRGRTCFLISHRVSTVQDADLIVVLDEGRVAERGTHADLIEADGLYADMYRRQMLEAELEAM